MFGKQHGAGLLFMSDALGVYNNLQFELSYAYRFDLGDGKMAIGITGGLFRHQMNSFIPITGKVIRADSVKRYQNDVWQVFAHFLSHLFLTVQAVRRISPRDLNWFHRLICTNY